MTEAESAVVSRPARRGGIFFGWWIVAATASLQGLYSGLFWQAYGAYVVLLRDEFGWSKTMLSTAYSFAQAESGTIGPVTGVLLDRFGPLFADDAEVAEALFTAASSRVAGAPVFLDVPERNRAALDLVARHDLTEVFGCARMTYGPPPALPWDEIFGVTTYELG